MKMAAARIPDSTQAPMGVTPAAPSACPALGSAAQRARSARARDGYSEGAT